MKKKSSHVKIEKHKNSFILISEKRMLILETPVVLLSKTKIIVKPGDTIKTLNDSLYNSLYRKVIPNNEIGFINEVIFNK